MSDDTQETMTVDEQKPAHARECGKPGPCEWCDSLQLNEDSAFFMEEKQWEYDGETYDRGQRLAAEVERLRVVGYQHVDRIETLEEELRALRPKYVEAFDLGRRFEEREPLVQALLSCVRLSAGCINPMDMYTEIQDASDAVQAFDLGAKVEPVDCGDCGHRATDGECPECGPLEPAEPKPVDGALSVCDAENIIETDDVDMCEMNLEAGKTLAAEVRRLREQVERLEPMAARVELCEHNAGAEYRRAERYYVELEQVKADRDRLRTELERRNVVHVDPEILAKDGDVLVSAAESEATIDTLAAEVRRLRESLADVAARHARVHDEADKYQLRALDAERELSQLRAERDDALKAQEAAELRIVALRAEIRDMAGELMTLPTKEEAQRLHGVEERVQALIDMQHADSTVSVSSIREALGL